VEHKRTDEGTELTAALARDLAHDLDAAFERFVLAYQRRLYSFALRLAGNASDAEEIAQDAFVRAYRALVGYTPERIQALALRPWLYQIALNVVRNRIRGHRLALVSLDGARDGDDGERRAAVEVEDDPAERPEARIVADERRRELGARLAALPTRYRLAVVLRHVEGFSYAEIAALLGQPVGTVKANVHRGVLLLRGALVAVAEGV
jgi:RNA polymerase sigma-70 factor (ECF subfamily)